MLAKLKDEEGRLLEAVHSTPRPTEKMVEAYVTAARRRYALCGDLMEVTGDLHYRPSWNVRRELGELARLSATLNASPYAPKPPIKSEWRHLLADAREDD